MTQKLSPEVFVSAARIASAMRSRSACEIIAAPHQLPDEPPPPNEPPPPENPPPPESDEPDDQPEPPEALGQYHDERPAGLGARCSQTRIFVNSTNRKCMSTIKRISPGPLNRNGARNPKKPKSGDDTLSFFGCAWRLNSSA